MLKFTILLLAFFGNSCESVNESVSTSKNTNTPFLDRVIDSKKLDSTIENNTDTNFIECTDFDFKYVEVSNVIQNERIRSVSIFMDEREFSETNLRKLFQFLSSKYSNPGVVIISVNTSWEQLSCNSSLPGTGSSSNPENSDKNKYHWAKFRASGTGKAFTYNLKKIDNEIRTIDITNDK